MKKPTTEDFRIATESMMWTLSLFNKGYQTIRKENPEISVIQVSKLTEIWWNGVMTMMGMSQDKSDNGLERI